MRNDKKRHFPTVHRFFTIIKAKKDRTDLSVQSILRCFLSFLLGFLLVKIPAKPFDIVWYLSRVLIVAAHCKPCILCAQFFKGSLSELPHIAGSRSDFLGDLFGVLVFQKKRYDLMLLGCESFHTFAQQLVLKEIFDAFDKLSLNSLLKRVHTIVFAL